MRISYLMDLRSDVSRDYSIGRRFVPRSMARLLHSVLMVGWLGGAATAQDGAPAPPPIPTPASSTPATSGTPHPASQATNPTAAPAPQSAARSAGRDSPRACPAPAARTPAGNVQPQHA